MSRGLFPFISFYIFFVFVPTGCLLLLFVRTISCWVFHSVIHLISWTYPNWPKLSLGKFSLSILEKQICPNCYLLTNRTGPLSQFTYSLRRLVILTIQLEEDSTATPPKTMVWLSKEAWSWLSVCPTRLWSQKINDVIATPFSPGPLFCECTAYMAPQDGEQHVGVNLVLVISYH